jgi:hypothetical protein
VRLSRVWATASVEGPPPPGRSWHDGLTVDCYAGLRAGAWCSAASHCIQNISGVPPGTFRPPRGGLNMQHPTAQVCRLVVTSRREKAPARDATRVHHTSQRRDRVIDPLVAGDARTAVRHSTLAIWIGAAERSPGVGARDRIGGVRTSKNTSITERNRRWKPFSPQSVPQPACLC